jgi:predicted nucleic acid-binding protein
MPGDSRGRQQLLTAVSNSSPLILYARIGRLELLKALFDEILIPPAVWHEVVTGATGRIGEREVRQTEWIRRRPLLTGTIPTRFANLDLGEAEALALASSLDAVAPVLLDDERARRVARDAGLFVIGSAGILGRAKEVGLIPSIRRPLADLQAAGLYLGKGPMQRLLEIADEQ